MPKPDFYSQHADGTFHAKIVPGTPHCGVNDKSNTFRYEVDIKAKPEALSRPDGFLLDNTEFQTFFDELGEVRVSCEDLVRECAKRLVHAFGADRQQYVISVTVRFWPLQGVNVAYTYYPQHD